MIMISSYTKKLDDFFKTKTDINIPYNNGVKWSWSVLLTSAPASINIQAISANVASLSAASLFANDNDDEDDDLGGDRLEIKLKKFAKQKWQVDSTIVHEVMCDLVLFQHQYQHRLLIMLK
jgi:hypothetical protein